MERRKLTKADIDRVRDIEGFPIGTDEDIIALSDAPYYTACPNPYIEEFIRENGTPYDEATDDYHREPFAADVSEGKNDPLYVAHTYHTKVPYKAIMRYILHYTKPGDMIFDGFCGSGMTGVATQMASENDPEKRHAVLVDLSPVATFISSNYNHSIDEFALREKVDQILAEFEEKYGWLYKTNVDHPTLFSSGEAQINYTVWSDVFVCPHCGNEVVFWAAAVDREGKKLHDRFKCSKCGIELTKRTAELCQETVYDHVLNTTITRSKRVPVYIVCTAADGKRIEKIPDENDLATIEKARNCVSDYWIPSNRMCYGSESRRNDKYGMTHVHHFFSERN